VPPRLLADNIYSLQDWCKKQFAGREGELAAFYEQVGWRS
jgi:hypothetical protein